MGTTSGIKRVHPYAWLWEPLEGDASFVVRPMFGTKAAYLDGRLVLCFAARKEPWHGLLVCTERAHHASLLAELPALIPHPILPKWLYLADSTDEFDRVAERLVSLARRRDPRLGIVAPSTKKKKRPAQAKIHHEKRPRSTLPVLRRPL
jgi:hypothetical protein